METGCWIAPNSKPLSLGSHLSWPMELWSIQFLPPCPCLPLLIHLPSQPLLPRHFPPHLLLLLLFLEVLLPLFCLPLSFSSGFLPPLLFLPIPIFHPNLS